jgi:RNA polymerase sigma-70 factor, ECF subfamily
MNDTLATLYRQENRRVFSTLVRLLGSLDAAEEALHDAFVAAAEQWPTKGVPANPVAWLVSTGRFKAIDRIRRGKRFVGWDEAAEQAEAVADDAPGWEQQVDERDAIEDDRLRLVFTCCHPSLAEEARIALTLREVCGLTTEAIAGAFLVATPTLAQRIVRAKAKIAAARIPYEVPGPAERPARLASVLRVVYLVFNEGHAAHAAALADEAIRLARLLRALLCEPHAVRPPEPKVASTSAPAPEPEVLGLLALLLLHDARRAARTTAAGELVPLEEQNRALWNCDAITEGCALAQAALSQHGFGAYALQAAIAALHGEAESAAQTDWPQIVGLYDALLRIEPSPVIALNRAVAVAMRDGPEAGLALIEPLLPALPGYHAAPAAAADLCRRAGRLHEAQAHYRSAAALARQEPERRFLLRRLAEVGG